MAKKNNKADKKPVKKAEVKAEEKDIETTETELNEDAVKVEKNEEVKEVKKEEPKAIQIETKKFDKQPIKTLWFRDFKAELKRVVWPSQKNLAENTVVVVSMVVIVSLTIFVLDLAFGALTEFEIKQVEKLKNSITASNVVEENTTNNTTADNLVNDNKNNAVNNSTEANATILENNNIAN